MSLSAAPHAASQGNQSVLEAEATRPNVKCFLQNVLSVAKTPKYLLNLAVVDQCIVAIAIVKSN